MCEKNQKRGYWVLGVTLEFKLPPSSCVSPTVVPPLHEFEGTHDVRSAWGNTDAIDFVAIASSLQATNGRRAVGNTNRLKAVSLVHGRKKSTLARSLVLIVKLDARYGHRPAIPIPSTKLHIPLISRLRMSERYDFLTSFAIFEIKETIATSTRKPPKSFLSNSPFASVAKNEQPTQAIIDGTSI